MSEQSKLTFTGTLNSEELVYYRLTLENLSLRKSIRFSFAALFVGVSVLSSWALYNFPFNWPSIFLLITSAVMLYWLIIHPKLTATLYSRKYSKIVIENTAEISHERISVWNEKSGLWLSWQSIYCLLDTPQGVMFLFSPTSIWFFLPNRCFDNRHSKEVLFELAKGQNTKIKKFA
jgi:hypothetical protein